MLSAAEELTNISNQTFVNDSISTVNFLSVGKTEAKLQSFTEDEKQQNDSTLLFQSESLDNASIHLFNDNNECRTRDVSIKINFSNN